MTGWAQAALFVSKPELPLLAAEDATASKGSQRETELWGPRAEAQHPGKLRPAQEPKAPRAAGHASLCGSLPLFCGEKGERLLGVFMKILSFLGMRGTSEFFRGVSAPTTDPAPPPLRTVKTCQLSSESPSRGISLLSSQPRSPKSSRRAGRPAPQLRGFGPWHYWGPCRHRSKPSARASPLPPSAGACRPRGSGT